MKIITKKEYAETERMRIQKEAQVDARIAESEKSLRTHGGIPLEEAVKDVTDAIRKRHGL